MRVRLDNGAAHTAEPTTTFAVWGYGFHSAVVFLEAGVVKLADARDSKSRDLYRS